MKTSVLILSLVVCAATAQAAADACKATAKAASKACLTGAKSDYSLALGNCTNIADPVEQTAGVDGAHPGIVMKANPMLGEFYRQEFALGTAEDNAEVTGLNESVSVPAGDFNGCLKFTETTPLEPDALEDKFFAPGVGQVLTIDRETGERLELVQKFVD